MPVSVDARSPMESWEDYIPEDDEGGSDDDGFFDEQGGLEEVGEFFSEARLEQLVGTNDVESVTFLEVRINTEEIMMRDLGMRLPNLSELKLNNSNVPSMRDRASTETCMLYDMPLPSKGKFQMRLQRRCECRSTPTKVSKSVVCS